MLAGLIYRDCVGGAARRVPLPISCSLAKVRQHRTQNVLVFIMKHKNSLVVVELPRVKYSKSIILLNALINRHAALRKKSQGSFSVCSLIRIITALKLNIEKRWHLSAVCHRIICTKKYSVMLRCYNIINNTIIIEPNIK